MYCSVMLQQGLTSVLDKLTVTSIYFTTVWVNRSKMAVFNELQNYLFMSEESILHTG